MRAWPFRVWVLIGGMLALTAVVMGVLAWAGLSGRAGSQRGLVIHNDLTNTIRVAAAGQEAVIAPGYEWTFVVKREQFPAQIYVFENETHPEAAWRQVFNEFYEYEDLADAEFRLSVDEQGIHKTSTYRDTAVPRMTEAP